VKLHWLTLKIVGLALLFSASLLAQGTGDISGIVQDESGAVIPGVDVTVTNVDTGIGNSFVTNETGAYHLPSLIPGHYEIRAQLGGFETAVRRGIELTVGASLNIPMVLKVGQIAQETIVTGEAPVVNTVNSTVSGLVDEVTIRELPLNGRSFDQLIALDSSTPTFRSRGRAAQYGQVDLYTVNGAGVASNLYMMDGTEMPGAGLGFQIPGGVLGKNLGVDAIQEFAVLTSNYSAAYGKKGGGIVNIATRSGTNDLHGTVYEYLRNSAFDARNFFDKRIPPFKRNSFGASLGGPVKKDRTFFFGNYEGLREGLGLSKVQVVPDENAHRGFVPDPQHPGQLMNIGVAPSVKPYLDTLFPLPNGRNFGDGTGEYITNPTQINNMDFYLARIDQKISDKDFLFGRFNWDHSNQSSPAFSQASPLYNASATNYDRLLTLEEKRLFSSRTVNLLRFGIGRAFVQQNQNANNPTDPALLALNLVPGADILGTIRFSASGNGVAQQGLTAVSVGSCGEKPCVAGFFATTQLEVSDQLFEYVGSHSLQVGVQYQNNREYQGSASVGTQGTYVFQGGVPSFLQGKPSQYSGVTPGAPNDSHKSYRRVYFSTYLQDDYKVGRNLTLNLGLRYELFTVPIEASGNRISNYRSSIVNGFLVLNPTPTLGSPMFNGSHLNIAPRFGFAWDPEGNGKMAVRGGYGMFYDQEIQSHIFYLSANPPYTSSVQFTNPAFPNAYVGTGTTPLPSPSSLDPNWKTPTRLQYTFSIQREVAGNTSVTVGYVGSHSYHTGRIFNANTFVPTFLPDGTVYFPATAARLQPALASSSRYVTTDGVNSYNALQTDLTQRLSRGLRFRVSYTFSKNIDLASGFVASYANGELGMTQNPWNVRGERGLSPYDVRHSFVSNFTYEIPWKSKSGFSGKVMGGWELGGIVTLHSGTPFTPTTGFNRSRSGDNSAPDRPNLKPGVKKIPILGDPNHYFDSSVFELPAAGFFGNAGRNIITAPGFSDFDFTLHKTTAVNERLRTDFRAEFFNILNHPNFDLPSAQIFDGSGQYLGSAGHIAQTVNTSRQIQFGLKLIF
jgi:hypothetical protein